MMERYSDFEIKALLKKLENEGIESVYQSVKKWKISNGSSAFSSLTNDLIGCCPSSEEWKNPNVREFFKQNVVYYCNYYLSSDD